MKAYDVKRLRPWRGRAILVEGHFGREFSMHELCAKLQSIARCSEKLAALAFPARGVTSLSIQMDESCMGWLLRRRPSNLSTI